MAAKKTKKKAKKCVVVPVVEHERSCPGAPKKRRAKKPLAQSRQARPRGGSAGAKPRTARGVGQSPTKKKAGAKRTSRAQLTLDDWGAPKRRRNPGQAEYKALHWGDVGPVDSFTVDRVPNPRSGTPVMLGELVEVVYRTAKGGDGWSDYEHRFRATDRPSLIVTADGGLAIVGGSYRVEKRGIIG